MGHLGTQVSSIFWEGGLPVMGPQFTFPSHGWAGNAICYLWLRPRYRFSTKVQMVILNHGKTYFLFFFPSLKSIVSHLKPLPLFLPWVRISCRSRLRGAYGGVGRGYPARGWMRGAERGWHPSPGFWLTWAWWSVFAGAGTQQTRLNYSQIKLSTIFRRGFLQIHKLQLCQENTNCLQFSRCPFSPPSVSVLPHWIYSTSLEM